MNLRIGRPGFTPHSSTSRSADIPASPPADVLRDVDAAWWRAEVLRQAWRELHFDVDGDSGRVTVQMRDLDGNVIRAIAPSEALEILSGRAI